MDGKQRQLQAERFEIRDDLWAAQSFLRRKGLVRWLADHPADRRARRTNARAARKRNPQDVIGAVPPRWAQATVEKIAING